MAVVESLSATRQYRAIRKRGKVSEWNEGKTSFEGDWQKNPSTFLLNLRHSWPDPGFTCQESRVDLVRNDHGLLIISRTFSTGCESLAVMIAEVPIGASSALSQNGAA